jgi:hypothetical protein
LTTAEGRLRFASQFVRRDDEYALFTFIGHVNYLQVTTCNSLAQLHPGTALPGEVFAGATHYLLNFRFAHPMVINMQVARIRIDVMM